MGPLPARPLPPWDQRDPSGAKIVHGSCGRETEALRLTGIVLPSPEALDHYAQDQGASRTEGCSYLSLALPPDLRLYDVLAPHHMLADQSLDLPRMLRPHQAHHFFMVFH